MGEYNRLKKNDLMKNGGYYYVNGLGIVHLTERNSKFPIDGGYWVSCAVGATFVKADDLKMTISSERTVKDASVTAMKIVGNLGQCGIKWNLDAADIAGIATAALHNIIWYKLSVRSNIEDLLKRFAL